MAGATPKQAVENFVRPIQQGLACVTAAVIDRQGEYALGKTYGLTLKGGEGVRLSRASGRGSVGVRISQQYRVVRAEGDRGPYKVETTAYMYAVEDDGGQGIFGYHWHPHGSSGVRLPHLHLEAGAHIGHTEIRGAHFPTGRISVEQFLRLVIETFKVKTRRSDWRSVLQQAQQAFRKWQTWA